MKPFFFFACCLLTLTVFSQPAQKLPPRSKIIFFGDSHTSYGYGVKDNSVQFQNNGYVAWVNALSPGIQIPANGIQAVPGETTVQMMARLQAVRSSDARILVILAGTNDVLLAVNPETTKANLRTFINTGKTAGMRVILLTIPPQFNPPAYHDIVEDFRQNVNTWIRTQTDVTIVDAEPDLKEKRWYEDERHLTPEGALVLARKVADVINSWVEACLPGSGTVAQLSAAGNDNPFLQGTGGKKPGASGLVASNWELSGTFAGGATVTAAKESAGNGEKQVINISGTYSGNSRRVSFFNEAQPPITLSTGNLAEGVAEVEILNELTGIKSIYLKVTANNSDYSTILAEGVSLFNTSSLPASLPPGTYLLRTPAMTVGAGGAVAHLTTQILIEFKNTSSVSPVAATLKIRSAGIRRLPLSDGPMAAITPGTAQTICPNNPIVLEANADNRFAYQWTSNGSDIAGQNAATFSAAAPGLYAVKVSADGCTVQSAPVVVTSGTCQPETMISTSDLPATLCAGQSLPVTFSATGTFSASNVFTVQLSDAQGSFLQPTVIASAVRTTGGTINAQLPASTPAGTAYRVRVVSSQPVVTGSPNAVGVRVPEKPVITSTLTPAPVCNNANFAYTPAASVAGAVFQWSRAAVSGINNATAKGSGSISEALQNTTGAPVSVTYDYTVSAEGCSNNQVYKVTVLVQPSPVARTKNIRVVLNASGNATIDPQEVNNDSQGFCGTLQYSVDKNSFTCANIGVNTVVLQATDDAGNRNTATATVTVVDEMAPVISSVSATPATLLFADGKMATIKLDYIITDNCVVPPVITVKSNEPQAGLFAGDQSPDWQIIDSKTVQLRAERGPGGTGRTYTITITSRDAGGNSAEKEVTVTVPVYTSLSIAGTDQSLQLLAYPNPFQKKLTLQLNSPSAEPVNIRIMDAAGRILQTLTNIAPNNSFTVGDFLRPGVYFLEGHQGRQKIILRLIKLAN